MSYFANNFSSPSYLVQDGLSKDSNQNWVKVAALICAGLGTIHNGLSVGVLTGKDLRRLSWSMYLIVVAVVDTIWLNIQGLDAFLQLQFEIKMEDTSPAGCKIFNYIFRFIVQCSNWILIAATFERLVFLFSPARARVYCRRIVACGVMSVIVIVLLAYNLREIFVWELSDDPSFKYETKFTCRPALNLTYFDATSNTTIYSALADGNHKLWAWSYLVIGSLLPFLVMVVLDATMIIRLVDIGKQVIKGKSGKMVKMSSVMKIQRSERTTNVIMMITCTILVMILMLPLMIMEVYILTGVMESDLTNRQSLDLKYGLQACDFMRLLAPALKFWVFSVTSSSYKFTCNKDYQITRYMVCGMPLY
ncbi:unnamed protein product [Owenia fusiformis]|uniref:G-protein coupled receptors family 1 profile domain-containing protein n=1 Tax=Owenia fusiformis TaxID=6347 RepID=A0A8S4NNL7_OWEFU|nr:unnamed protein product [Owenia fusiformis]